MTGIGADWQTLFKHGEPNEASQDARVVVSARLDKPWMRWKYSQPEDRVVGDAGWGCRSAGVGAQPCRRRQSCKDTMARTPKRFVLSLSCQHLSENEESATHAAYLEQLWQKEALVHRVTPGVGDLHLLVNGGSRGAGVRYIAVRGNSKRSAEAGLKAAATMYWEGKFLRRSVSSLPKH
jgi:hypothetical protein